jgi:hypothetical protein
MGMRELKMGPVGKNYLDGMDKAMSFASVAEKVTELEVVRAMR